MFRRRRSRMSEAAGSGITIYNLRGLTARDWAKFESPRMMASDEGYSLLLPTLFDVPVLSSVCAWLCQRRRGYEPCADVCNFRGHWPESNARIFAGFSLLAQRTVGGHSSFAMNTKSANHRALENFPAGRFWILASDSACAGAVPTVAPTAPAVLSRQRSRR